MQRLHFEFKRVYGRVKFYPLDSISQAFCSLMDRLCLNEDDMLRIYKLNLKGVRVEIEKDGEMLTNTEVLALFEK